SRKVAFEFGEAEFKKYSRLAEKCKKIIDLKGAAAEMRAIKSSREIEYIKKAQAHCLEFAQSISPEEWEGRTEAELAGRLCALAWENGMSGPSFTPIVSAARNSSSPHHIPGEDIIEGLLMIDFGARYKGYCSDLTRTFILDKFIKTFNTQKLYESLKKAKEKAAALLRPGVSCGQIYSAAKESLEKDGLGKYFIHSLGHGVGLDIHERPYLKPGSKEILKEGMVLTVEPGIYIKEAFGMRTEDIYLITGEGRQRLNRKFR
ncbi:MAG: M24 family metallopeptidase, partial [Elusimicrobiota bacterium]|nr:M24 family metallopeptidase [Elusimicrobiota bacterium]